MLVHCTIVLVKTRFQETFPYRYVPCVFFFFQGTAEPSLVSIADVQSVTKYPDVLAENGGDMEQR